MSRTRILICFWVCLCAGWASAQPAAPVYLLDVGRSDDEGYLGYGWSRPEGAHGQSFRWIDRFEADVWLPLTEPADLRLSVRAWAAWVEWRRQRIGLFVNNRYVTEWPGPDDAKSYEYEALVPEEYWVAGTNRLTLRMAYRVRLGKDSRKLALAVEQIELREP